MQRNDPHTRYLAAKAAWLSFIAGYTQRRIADEMLISQPTVHRLLALAQEIGVVSVRVDPNYCRALELEVAIKERFGLQACMIVPDAGDFDGAALQSVAAAAAHYLAGLLEREDEVEQIGVGMGRTMSALAGAMTPLLRPDLKIVSITGSLMRKLAANPLDVVTRLQQKTGGEGYFLPVPYLARTVAERKAFQSYDSVRELISLAKQSDLFFVGIGSMDDQSNLAQTEAITSDELSDLRSAGVAGDIAGSFFGVDGRLIDVELSRKTVGLRGADLKGRRVVAVAAGAGKTDAVLGVLRSGLVSEIIADKHLATAVMAKAGGNG